MDRWLARPPCHPCSYHRGPEGSFTYINIYIFRRINLFVYFIYRWPKCLVYLFSLARRWRDDVKPFFSGFRTLIPCEAGAVHRKKHQVDDNIRGKPCRSAGVKGRGRRGQECRLLVRIIVSELNDFSIGLSGCSSGGGVLFGTFESSFTAELIGPKQCSPPFLFGLLWGLNFASEYILMSYSTGHELKATKFVVTARKSIFFGIGDFRPFSPFDYPPLSAFFLILIFRKI